jgi:hypothetical protein
MTQPFDIQSLVDELVPVRSANPLRSVLFPIAAMLIALAAVIMVLGIRAEFQAVCSCYAAAYYCYLALQALGLLSGWQARQLAVMVTDGKQPWLQLHCFRYLQY